MDPEICTYINIINNYTVYIIYKKKVYKYLYQNHLSCKQKTCLEQNQVHILWHAANLPSQPSIHSPPGSRVSLDHDMSVANTFTYRIHGNGIFTY